MTRFFSSPLAIFGLTELLLVSWLVVMAVGKARDQNWTTPCFVAGLHWSPLFALFGNAPQKIIKSPVGRVLRNRTSNF